MPSTSIEHVVELSVRRLIVHTASIKPDATSIALVILGQPLGTDPSVPPPQMIYSLPKTLAPSCLVQVGPSGERDVIVDTGTQLYFDATTTYRTETDAFDLFGPVSASTNTSSPGPRGATLCPSKVLQVWLVSVSPSNSADSKKKHRNQPCFSCVAYVNIPLPLALFTQQGGVNVDALGRIELPLYTPTDKDRRNPVAVISLCAEEALHGKHLKRAQAALDRGAQCTYRSRGTHSRRATAATMAAGVQQRAHKLFEKMKSAFEKNSSDSGDEVVSTIAASSLVSAPASKSNSGLSAKSVTAAPLDCTTPPPAGPPRSLYSFTVPLSSGALRQADSAASTRSATTSQYLVRDRVYRNVVVFDGIPQFMTHYNSHVGAAAESIPQGAVLFVYETYATGRQQDPHSNTLVNALVAMGWPIPILVLVVDHQEFQDDSGNLCRGLSDVLQLFLTRYDRTKLPGVWFMASDALTSECLAILVAWFRDRPPGVAQSQHPAVGIMFAASPTLQLGFDDLHRASLQLQGERTPPPRSTSVAGSLQRLQPLLQSLTHVTDRLLDLRVTLPISCAVITIVNGDSAVETRRIYFSKCLHVLCARGLEVRFDATEEAPSVTNSKRRWTNVGRDPVLVGVYRFPCQGHFDYALYPGASPGTPGDTTSDIDVDAAAARAPPPLRMWTTRKRIGGLTVGSNALVPDFMCTSLYGQSFSCVEMKATSKKCVLSVFVDSDRPPTFDDDSSTGVPHLPGSGDSGDMKGLVMGVECSAVSISAFDVAHIPLFPCR
jgi:hypothetical protein